MCHIRIREVRVLYELITCKASVVIFNSSDKPLCLPAEYCGAAHGDWNFPQNSSSCKTKLQLQFIQVIFLMYGLTVL